MKNKDIIKFAYFFERYRYTNSFINKTDHQFLIYFKEFIKNNIRRDNS